MNQKSKLMYVNSIQIINLYIDLENLVVFWTRTMYLLLYKVQHPPQEKKNTKPQPNHPPKKNQTNQNSAYIISINIYNIYILHAHNTQHKFCIKTIFKTEQNIYTLISLIWCWTG